MKNLKNISIAVSVLLLGVFLFVFNENNFDFEMNSDKSHIDKSNKSEELKNEIKENKSEVEIFAMGDMIFHQPIVKNYKTENSFDFTPIFQNISEDINEADIAIANFEGSVNSNRALSGFPLFNFPKESISSLKNVGFDVLSTANNHCLDTGIDGLAETISVINENNMKSFGTFTEDIDKGIVVEEKGIKIGLISFTDTLNGMDSLMIGKEYSVNNFSQDVESDIKKLKDKSDIVIVYPHWGNEYQLVPNERQIYLKEKLQEYGADIILGSHPHVLQKYEVEEKNNKKYFTIYSMGNALSNQRVENLKKSGVDTGAIVKLIIEKDNNTKDTNIKSYGVYPTYVDRYRKNGKLNYDIIKLEDVVEGGKLNKVTRPELKNVADKKLSDALRVLKGEI
ncbi:MULTISPECIES: CapA family protein [Peptoniphilus]|uniref:CapA family protein n=1 Tax=Peptoniphilus TaxID=162289 RepID=UPI0008D94E01|nr:MULTISPECIES: CapA family protein [Peptoniphilus]MDU1043552.1 CapA family protein [Peptoniphilus rhinitidis]MDU2115626.1 CapA family protein [Peptoniphilus lacydonensis]MDU3751413.1 CapA family protein [Peptoniphilus rhinitidis]MDU7301692.1 CapA family protein [Peptoniphilus lacydonensis]